MKTALISAAVAAMAIGTAVPADAATAYMGGLLGTQPGFSTITGPNGERVNTGWQVFGGNERIGWDNFSQESAKNAQIAWLEAHQGEQNTLWVYSATSNSINKVAAERPELLANTTVIAIAPPKATSLDYAPVPTPSTFRQYQVIAKGDSVADEGGTSFSTHTGGYKNLNLQTATPVSSSTVPGTNTTRSYYNRPSAPTKAQRAEIKAEKAAAAKAARAERQERARANWAKFTAKLRGDKADSAEGVKTTSSDSAE